MSLFDLQDEVEDLVLAGTGKLLIDDSKKVLVSELRGKPRSKGKPKQKNDPLDEYVFKEDITVDQFEEKMREREHKKLSDELAAGQMSDWDRRWGKQKKEKKPKKKELCWNLKREEEAGSTPPRGPRIPKVS